MSKICRVPSHYKVAPENWLFFGRRGQWCCDLSADLYRERYDRTPDRRQNMLWQKEKTVLTTKVPLHSSKISWTLAYIWLTFGDHRSPPLNRMFPLSSLTRSSSNASAKYLKLNTNNWVFPSLKRGPQNCPFPVILRRHITARKSSKRNALLQTNGWKDFPTTKGRLIPQKLVNFGWLTYGQHYLNPWRVSRMPSASWTRCSILIADTIQSRLARKTHIKPVWLQFLTIFKFQCDRSLLCICVPFDNAVVTRHTINSHWWTSVFLWLMIIIYKNGSEHIKENWSSSDCLYLTADNSFKCAVVAFHLSVILHVGRTATPDVKYTTTGGWV